jgi:hypothetical protein
MLIRCRFSTEEPVKVVVGTGSEQTVHYLPPAALKAKSGFFRGCLSGPFKESEEKVITLSDIDPKTFAFFVEWLFSNKVWHVTTKDSKTAEQDEMDKIDVWLLADRLLAEGLQNHCMDSIRHALAVQQWVYGGPKVLCGPSSTSSQLKAYYIEEMAWSMASCRNDPDQWKVWLEELETIFDKADGATSKKLFLAYDAMKDKFDDGEPLQPAEWGGCEFHVHVETSKKECESKFDECVCDACGRWCQCIR